MKNRIKLIFIEFAVLMQVILFLTISAGHAQPGIDDYAYKRSIVYHSDLSKCEHLPPDVSFIVMLNDNDSTILTDQCPRWAVGESNINGDGLIGVELGNFINPEIAVGDSFTLIFSCNITKEQGKDKDKIDELPFSSLNFHLKLSPDSYLPPVKNLTTELDNNNINLSWTSLPGLKYLIYRRDINDVLDDGRARYQYYKIAEVNSDSTYRDTSVESNHLYAYLILAKDSTGLISARSEEVRAIPPIIITSVIPRNTTVELKFKPATEIGSIPIAGYNLYRRVEGGEYPAQPIAYLDADTCYTDSRLNENTTYFYIIHSRDFQGNELSASEEISATTDDQADKYTKYASLEILVVLYTHTSGGDILPEEIPKIKKMIEKARLFYWRNSGLKMNLDISYLIIDEYLKADPSDYSISKVENDLHKYGVQDLQYDAIFRISSATSGFWSYGTPSWSFMGPPNSTGFSHICWAAARGIKAAPYPIYDPNINYGLTWLFTHEFQHAMDDIYNDNGNPEMYHGDMPWEFPVACGEEYDFQAKIYRNFHNWLALKGYRGQILESEDIDNDGIPDNDIRVPLDEIRFGSDSLNKDSDSDGLSDYQEIKAGIYEGTNPNISDTDDDGIQDDRDKYPLYPVNVLIPRFSPILNGTIEDGWHLLVDKLNFTTTSSFNCKIYVNWDANYLYLALKMKAYAIPTIFIDAKADGWWHGSDNYRISFYPNSGAIREAKILDCSEEALNYSDSIGNRAPMWDNDSKYIKHFGRIIEDSDFQIFSKTTTNGYSVEMIIPQNTKSGLILAEGDSIGLRLLFENMESSWDNWATAFEQYSFVNVKLVGTTGLENKTVNGQIPDEFSLEQNYPNPFNPVTTIYYSLPKTSDVTIAVFNMLGQKVKTLIDAKDQKAGVYNVVWNGKDQFENQVSSGIYFYCIRADNFTRTKKMILLR